MDPRPIMLGIAGDSGSGKTTISRGLVRVLGEGQVTRISSDDYHRYDRRERRIRGLTPLNPECNYLDILIQHLRLLRSGEPILKPVYRHADGTFGPPVHVQPTRFIVTEGLLAFATPALREMYDVRVFLAPPEELRRRWKVARDCSRRGYTTDEVLEELDRREPDADAFVRPQRHHADIVVSFEADSVDDPAHLDAHVVLRNTLPHPDLSGVVSSDGKDGLILIERRDVQELYVAGNIDPARAGEIEEAIWERMHFASHLRQQRLGEFTVGTDLRRSDSLAIVQLLLLYHLATARAIVSLGGESARTEAAERAGSQPEQS
ncbi:MAG TPA: phosphoribulokinase [Gaiellaceae bacterium]|nr:phosphoribulokinase [Gaiellaceae bacterium]